MKRILTLIVTLVCVFAAYSQNTVYIWKDNTLSVQAADSIAFYADNVVDLGLSVCWESDDAYSGYNISWDNADASASYSEGRLPTKEEFEELFSRCSWERIDKVGPNDLIKFIGPNGNIMYLNQTHYNSSYPSYSYFRFWTNSPYVLVEVFYDSYSGPSLSFDSDSTKNCHARFVWDN